MRAAVIVEPRSIRVREVEPPQPGAGQLRVRVEGSGVCASNLPVWDGRPWFSYPVAPGAPGHEGWGVVEALGPDTSAVPVGQRVAFLSERAYADYDIVESANVVPLPATLDGTPCPGEPLGCAVNAYHRSEIRPGDWVAVVGVGFMGALLVQLAVSAGARVIAVSRRPFARRLAIRLGAEEVVEFAPAASVAARVARIAGTQLLPRVIEAVGNQEALDIATALVGVRGRLIICGYHQDGSRTIDLQLWNWRGIDVVNAHERDSAVYVRGMAAALAMAAAGTLDVGSLITHVCPLAEIERAFHWLDERPEGFLKAAVLMS